MSILPDYCMSSKDADWLAGRRGNFKNTLPRFADFYSPTIHFVSGQPLSGPLVSPLPPAPTTPSATWPPWSPLATSTPQDTQPGSVPLFALVTLTAKP